MNKIKHKSKGFSHWVMRRAKESDVLRMWVRLWGDTPMPRYDYADFSRFPCEVTDDGIEKLDLTQI